MNKEPAQLIETMRVDPGDQIALLHRHLARLRASCTAMDYDWPGGPLTDALRHHREQLDTTLTYRLRLLVGPGRSYSIETTALAPTVQPVTLHLSPEPLKADAFWLRHKTTHRPWYAAAQRWLDDHPACFDVIFFNAGDMLSEGTRSNVYVQDRAGVWLTPPLDCGALPGVQRQALLDSGQVQEAAISRPQFMAATSLRVSNALRGWLDARLELSTDAGAHPIMNP